jgi:hypothetical protein
MNMVWPLLDNLEVPTLMVTIDELHIIGIPCTIAALPREADGWQDTALQNTHSPCQTVPCGVGFDAASPQGS